jgi:hypothetical protein
MPTSLQWQGNLSVTAPGPLEVPTLESFVLDGRYLYAEKQVLIDALELWLTCASLPWKDLRL